MSTRRVLLTAVLAFLPVAAWAAGDAGLTDRQLWVKECGSCHDAYPSGLLPGYAWKKIMDTLDKHFGVDARLGDSVRGKITAYLVDGRATDIPLRVTEQDWFRSIHGSPEAYLKQTGIPLSNCGHCHKIDTP
ncbi:MAG: hypothetical protein A2516_12095 [Alphaproteobacteria bacterium RIFOXYD12_FULL_60_8]|nr:MAG: hypothetical protein A2516_12095 [Alphaproteobacteria bacterium RIFOXYD12_FULL_60_8]